MDLDAVAPLPSVLLATPRGVLRMRSDAALVQRFRAGYEDAFGVLYERHRAGVLAVCIGVLGSRHDAEDAAQDAFAALATALRTNPPRELRPWLARVARNAAIDVIRRRRAVTEADETLEGQAPGTADVRFELESVFAGLRQLPETQRTALLMRELAGHSYQEIGTLLELDESAVRGLIARARIGLRAHREATEMPCAAAREALATEPDGRRRDKTVRRHVRTCASCKAYGRGLRRDAVSLRTILPVPAGGFAGGGAIFGTLAAKTALTGGALTQVTAACAVSVCAVGGIALLVPHGAAHHVHRAASARLVSAHRGTGEASTPFATRALDRALSGPQATGHPRWSSASDQAGATGSTGRSGSASSEPVVSSPTVALSHRFRVPGSGTPVPATGAKPPAGATPTTPASSPAHPIFWLPTRTGSTTTGWNAHPGAPAGYGSGRPGFGRGGAGTSGSTGTGATTSSGRSTGTGPNTASGRGTGATTGSGRSTGTGSTTGTSGSTGTGSTTGASGSTGTGSTTTGTSGTTGTTGTGSPPVHASYGADPADRSHGASATAALAGTLLGFW
jgi:RNA polymerase sigma factor (sigma-70 family)